jgi:hypothetical protein
MKFICLGYHDQAKFEALSDEQRNAMVDICFAYDDQLRANGHWAGGDALQPAENARTLRAKKGKAVITDGPYAETKEQIGGVLILEARDMEQAVQLMQQHPALHFGSIFEIRPTADLSEMMQASEQRRQKVAR